MGSSDCVYRRKHGAGRVVDCETKKDGIWQLSHEHDGFGKVGAAMAPNRASSIAKPILALAFSGIASCNACHPTEAPVHLDVVEERMDKPGPEVKAAYEKIRQIADKLGQIGRANQPIIPAMPRHRIACQVDTKQRLHVLRLPKAPEPLGSGSPQALEYAVLDGSEGTDPAWRTIAHIYGAHGPELFVRGKEVLGGVVGTLHPQTEVDEYFDRSFLVFRIVDDQETHPRVCVQRTGSSVSLAASSDNIALVLTHAYVSPIEDVSGVGLRVLRCEDGDPREIATGAILDTGITPEDYAVFGGSNGDIHVVYEGIRKEVRSSGKQLWHVTLNSEGALHASKPLGVGVEDPYLTQIFAGPDAQLYVLEVYEARRDGGTIAGKFAHRVLPLEVPAYEAGSNMHFFVDAWLQVHVVWFESNKPRYMGPAGVPSDPRTAK